MVSCLIQEEKHLIKLEMKSMFVIRASVESKDGNGWKLGQKRNLDLFVNEIAAVPNIFRWNPTISLNISLQGYRLIVTWTDVNISH